MNDRNKRKRLLLVLLLLLLLIGGAAWFFRADPVDRVRQLGQKLASKELSPDERKEIGKQFREELKQLTPQQRKVLRADRQKKMEEKLAAFFKLSKDKRLAELDKDIDRMQTVRKRMQDRALAGKGGFGPGDGAGNRAAGSRGGGAGSGSSTAAGTGSDGGNGTWKPKSPEQREAFRQTMLDNSSPQFRGQMAEYRQLLGSRMQQRGINGGFGGAGR